MKTLFAIAFTTFITAYSFSQGLIVPTSNQIDSTWSLYEQNTPTNTYGNRKNYVHVNRKKVFVKTKEFYLDSLAPQSVDPSGFLWIDANKKVNASQKSALTITKAQVSDFPSGISGVYGILTVVNGIVTGGKRQEPFSGTTNSSGVVSFSFSPAYSIIPNISGVNLGVGTTNKETVIMTALSTSGVTFKVEARSDVIGLLPSYSNVNGRLVDIVVTEK